MVLKEQRIAEILNGINAAEVMIQLIDDRAKREEIREAVGNAARKAIEEIRAEPTPRATAKVILFKETGKYYTEEEWRIPTVEEAEQRPGFMGGDMVAPYCMIYSPDFHRIGQGSVLVVSQEPWGFPHLL